MSDGVSSRKELVTLPPLNKSCRTMLEYFPASGKGLSSKLTIAGLDIKKGVLGVTGEDGNEAAEFNEDRSVLLFLENGGGIGRMAERWVSERDDTRWLSN